MNKTTYTYWQHNIFIGYLVVAIIILLNMLIAILKNSYTKIIEKQIKNGNLKKTKLILSLMMNNIIGKKKYKTVESINKLYCLKTINLSKVLKFQTRIYLMEQKITKKIWF